jgi:integrase
MASVEPWTPDPKTGKPRYRAHWRGVDGRPQSKVCRTQREATNLGVKKEAAKLDGTYIDHKAGQETLRSYSTTWLASQVFNDSSRETLERRIRVHMWPTLGDLQLGRIRASTVQAWVKGLACAPSTAGHILGNLSTIMSAAVDDGAIPKNPCLAKSVKAPTQIKSPVVPFVTDEVFGIIDGHPDRLRAIPVLAAGLGLRQGECFGLAVSDIDFLGRWVYVNRQVKRVHCHRRLALPKGGKKRKIPLPKWVAIELAEHIRRESVHSFAGIEVDEGADNPGDFLFGFNDRPLFAHNYNRIIWKPSITSLGIDASVRGNGLHRMRHTFASEMLSEGEDIASLAEWMGHSNATTTLRVYAHFMPKKEDRTRARMDNAFRRSDGCTDVAGGAVDAG